VGWSCGPRLWLHACSSSAELMFPGLTCQHLADRGTPVSARACCARVCLPLQHCFVWNALRCGTSQADQAIPLPHTVSTCWITDLDFIMVHDL
jgi:hypothetical protein